jgi:AcrR family transcriptional regulator
MSERMIINMMTPEGAFGRVERRDAAENRVRILLVARQLFAERGVAAVNMADIALAAGVGKGTLYRRFANKGELCFALMDDHLSKFQNEMLAQMQKMTLDGGSKLEQLSIFLMALVHFTEEHVPLLCEVQQLMLLQFVGQNLQLPHFWQYMTIQGLLEAADAAGEFPRGLDISLLADTLLAPLSADFYRFLRQVRGFTPEQIGGGLQSIVQGMGSRDRELN